MASDFTIESAVLLDRLARRGVILRDITFRCGVGSCAGMIHLNPELAVRHALEHHPKESKLEKESPSVPPVKSGL